MIVALFAGTAAAFYGLPVIPIGGTAPSPSAAILFVTLTDGRATVTVSSNYDLSEGSFGLLIPTPAAADLVERSSLDYTARFDAFTAPVVESLHCDDLVIRNEVDTVPGCRTTPWVPEPWPEARIAQTLLADRVPLEGNVLFDVLDHGDPTSWLAENGFVVPPGGQPVLDAWMADALPLVAVRFELINVTPGGWLPPVQLSYPVFGELALDLSGGAVFAVAEAELITTVITEEQDGEVLEATWPRAVIRNECMVKGPFTPWYDAELEEALGVPDVPQWLTEWTGPPDACEPCEAEPLDELDLAVFGYEGPPSSAWLTRIRYRWNPGEWTAPSVLIPSRHRVADSMLFYPYDGDVTWLVPECGSEIDLEATCPDLHLDGGCATVPISVLPTLLAALFLRRRRWVAMTLFAGSAQAATPHPRLELGAQFVPLSSERVSLELSDFEPGFGPPSAGVDARWAFVGWKHQSLGAALSLRMWRSDTFSGAKTLPMFTGADPAALLLWRTGSWGSRGVSGTGCFGAGLTAPVLDSDVWKPQVAWTADIEAGAGLVFGKEHRRTLVEIRGIVLPRTEGSHVDFDDRTQLPGWVWHVGQAALSLRVGVAIDPAPRVPEGLLGSPDVHLPAAEGQGDSGTNER